MEDAIESLEANNDINDIDSYDFNEPQNKRTYTYVSEFKRLPVYNFGIGKRQTYGYKVNKIKIQYLTRKIMTFH